MLHKARQFYDNMAELMHKLLNNNL